jgi:hypothetical protein
MAIVLSSSPGPLHIVRCGQTISGKVIFSNNKDQPTGTVTVSLVGTAETSFQKSRTVYNGKATLFHFSETLHDGFLPQNQYEWPFKFTFPTITVGDKKKWLDVPPFQVTEGHTLPPSMASESEDFDRNTGKGAVVYKLTSTFSKSPKVSIFGPSESAYLTLYHIPRRKFEIPDPQIALMGKANFTCVSEILGSTGGKSKPSLFKRIRTPRSIFEVAITTPLAIYVGGPLPIILSLTHDLQNSTAPDVPIIKLTSCQVTLLRTMHAVGKSILEEDGKFSNAEIILGREKLDIPLLETQNLSEILALPDFRTKFGMSFATYNLAQTFKLMVKVTVECAGKSFWTELRSRNINILSPFTKDTLERESENPASLLLNMNGIIEDNGEKGAVAAAGVSLLLGVLGIATSLM